MNKDTAREVLECIRQYIKTADSNDSQRFLLESEKEELQYWVKRFADLISFNT
jgi:hypothetical protein